MTLPGPFCEPLSSDSRRACCVHLCEDRSPRSPSPCHPADETTGKRYQLYLPAEVVTQRTDAPPTSANQVRIGGWFVSAAYAAGGVIEHAAVGWALECGRRRNPPGAPDQSHARTRTHWLAEGCAYQAVLQADLRCSRSDSISPRGTLARCAAQEDVPRSRRAPSPASMSPPSEQVEKISKFFVS